MAEPTPDPSPPPAPAAPDPPVPPASGEPKHPSATDILANKRLVDTVLPPLIFVSVYGATSLVPAAVAAVLVAIVLGIYRARRKEDVTGAIGGVFGTVFAAGFALISGRAEDYFVPRTITNSIFAVVLLGSIVVRKPVIGLAVQAFYGWPPEYVQQPRVQRVFTLLTIPFVVLFAARAIVYAILIDAGEVGLLAVISTIMGLPAFALVLVGCFAYFRRALKELPPPSATPRF